MKMDEIGYWSEIKLDIIKKYASAYSRIISSQTNPSLSHIYIDAFSGAGTHFSKTSNTFVPGSPLNALFVKPPFKEYHFIDLDKEKFETLKETAKDYPNTFCYQGNCNDLLTKKIFPRANYKNYARALCVLDPYGLHLNWDVIYTAGQMKSIEIFLNFPIADMNRNVLLRKNPNAVAQGQIERMNAFWGDESWRDTAYIEQPGLFENQNEKTTNLAVVKAFQKRLRDLAGFSYVPEPMAMRNSSNAVVYYLFFASSKAVAKDIVVDIFQKYKNKGF